MRRACFFVLMLIKMVMGARDTVVENDSLLSSVLDYACNSDEYLFFGTVNASFRRLFGERRETSVSACFQTLSRAKESEVLLLAPESAARHVMKCGSIDVLRHALSTGVVDSVNGALEHAIRTKDESLIASLETDFRESRLGPACLIAAVESGSLSMVRKYCQDGALDPTAPNFGMQDSYFFPFSAKERRMICNRWKVYVGDLLVEAAKDGGHLEILQWLHAHGIPAIEEQRDNPDVVGTAAIHGDRDMVDWMLRVGYKPSACEIPYASHSNDVRFLEWLESRGCLVNPASMDHCSNADPEVIAWLRAKGYEFLEVAA